MKEDNQLFIFFRGSNAETNFKQLKLLFLIFSSPFLLIFAINLKYFRIETNLYINA